jgi:hypothetical protein
VVFKQLADLVVDSAHLHLNILNSHFTVLFVPLLADRGTAAIFDEILKHEIVIHI